ncbi:DUF1566 domain-containing protein [Leptospira adleri]|uniref:Lcl C-terminal domain-containing protein n=1 Tax=Leptospira adleri TaxID=2023186 RepID=A0A2M9YTP3_9LEPT|nr:DUF1566 domain-containing protein [Leptospira adleri]PJZ54889.1 hypothetical protein CH380_04050 [Leptospira adleri]PJZ60060.1 hypothetical protein CH376_20495 [Leptospira adleri]
MKWGRVFLPWFFLGVLSVNAYTGPFTNIGDGTVLDQKSGLVWQRCASGQGSAGDSYTDCSVGAANAVAWTAALAYCNSLNLGGGGWRLPSVKELVSLVDYSKTASPFINQTFFPNAADSYWTSTTHPSGSYKFQAYQVIFTSGTYDTFDKATSAVRVRCVR